MPKYRKKPIVIEAFQWNGETDLMDAPDWLKGAMTVSDIWLSDGVMFVNTLEGDMVAQPNDYITQGIKGELYPCKPDIFEATYEKV